jgi:capsular exopolysaccharide synthesis family protein
MIGRRKKAKPKHLNTKRTLELVTAKNMPFGYVEAYKSIRTNLKFLTATGEANSFVITSALGLESKSNTAINLAITMAEENKKVIVVDGDLRKPIIHRLLNITTNGKGISGVLTGEVELKDALVHLNEFNIDVLPVGAVPPNPSELLSQKRMHDLIGYLKKQYDYVIVDAPPVSVVTDAAIIGGMVDGALLIVRSDYAPVEMVRLAKKKLEDVNVNIFGVILSRYNAKKGGKQSGYYYSYNNYYYYSYSSDKNRK